MRAELELYQLTVKLYKHQSPHQGPSHAPLTTIAGVTGGIANFAFSMYLRYRGDAFSMCLRYCVDAFSMNLRYR